MGGARILTCKSKLKQAIERWPVAEALARRALYRLNLANTELEVSALRRLPRGSLRTAVDIGAAVGEYSWLLARKAHHVYAFEPYPDHYAVLASLPHPRLQLERKALGPARGTAQLRIPLFAGNKAATRRATLEQHNTLNDAQGLKVVDVEVLALDDYLSQRDGLDQVDLIKIDVEGYETQVLQGALETLKSSRPTVLVEIEIRHNPTYAEAFDLLADLGYRAYYTPDGHHLKQVTANDLPQLQQTGHQPFTSSSHPRDQSLLYFNNFWFFSGRETPLLRCFETGTAKLGDQNSN